MQTIIQYQTQEQRTAIIQENSDKYLIEERNITEGNFLVFTTEKPIGLEVEELKKETTLLKAQSEANATRADFQEELIVEIAMLLY